MNVAIVGCGASGLASIKSCVDYGLNPTCFEKTDYIGGLWNFKKGQCDGEASVMKSTIINSSKEMMAFSDFPPPKHYPNFMHNSLVMEYFKHYASQFNLVQYIRFNTAVKDIHRSDDFDDSGKWKVTVMHYISGSEREYEFDGVLICIGHHVYPYIPNFIDEESFSGRILHIHDFKDADEFENKKVVIVGFGNSAGDAALQIAQKAHQTYISTRRGAWLWGRIEEGGYPRDVCMRSRLLNFISKFMPLRLILALMENKLITKFDHAKFGIQPTYRINEGHPLVNDDLPYRLLTGQIIIKPDVEKFTEEGILFTDGSLISTDVIILGTGYSFEFPFVEGGKLIKVDENEVSLYKNIFPANVTNNSLAVIGLIQPFGSTVPMAEMQSRVACSVISGRTRLPSPRNMLQDIQEIHIMRKERFVNSRRHTIQVDYLPYMDMLAEIIDCKPKLGAIFFKDPQLAAAIALGPMVNYQYRLKGPNSWIGAREAILTVWQRVEAPLNNCACARPHKDIRIVQNFPALLLILIIFLVILLFWGLC